MRKSEKPVKHYECNKNVFPLNTNLKNMTQVLYKKTSLSICMTLRGKCTFLPQIYNCLIECRIEEIHAEPSQSNLVSEIILIGQFDNVAIQNSNNGRGIIGCKAFSYNLGT